MTTPLIRLPRVDQTDPQSVKQNQRTTQANFDTLAAAVGSGSVTDLAPIATGTVVGRSTAGTGHPEVLTTLPTAVQANITDTGTLGDLTVTGAVTNSALTASLPVFSNGSKQLVSNTMTGTGSVVMSASPALTGAPTVNGSPLANMADAVILAPTAAGRNNIAPTTGTAEGVKMSAYGNTASILASSNWTTQGPGMSFTGPISQISGASSNTSYGYAQITDIGRIRITASYSVSINTSVGLGDYLDYGGVGIAPYNLDTTQSPGQQTQQQSPRGAWMANLTGPGKLHWIGYNSILTYDTGAAIVASTSYSGTITIDVSANKGSFKYDVTIRTQIPALSIDSTRTIVDGINNTAGSSTVGYVALAGNYAPSGTNGFSVTAITKVTTPTSKAISINDVTPTEKASVDWDGNVVAANITDNGTLSVTGSITNTNLSGTGTRLVTGSSIGLLGNATSITGGMSFSGSLIGSNLSGTNTGDQTSVSGNAGTATALQTARNINGVSFNGTADITVPAAAGTLTGATLAAGVTASSLTSVGTLGTLTVTGLATLNGTLNGKDVLFVLTDNDTGLFVVREGASNEYVRINTTNAAEAILFGNTTTNPVYSFLGPGRVAITGNVNIGGATNTTGVPLNVTGRISAGANGVYAFGVGQPSDVAAGNSEYIQLRHSGTAGELYTTKSGTGTFRDFIFYTSDVEKLRITSTGETKASGRLEAAKGADVASANDITLGAGGNLFVITGTTQINRITTTNWQAGSEITLKFSGALTLKHQGASTSGALARINLSGSVDFVTVANSRIKLFYDGTDWWDISRSSP